jgi:AraC-like DNA-binding protein
MSSVELMLRLAGVTMLAFNAVLWLRGLRGSLVGPLGALFCFGIASYLLCPPLVRVWQLGLLELPFFFGCFGVAVFFWLMSRAIFDDRFRLRPWHGAVLLVMEGLGGWHRYTQSLPPETRTTFDPAQLSLVLHQLLSLGITVSALVLAFLGRAGDLVETRRRFRDVFVGVSGLYILIVTATEIYLRARPAAPALELVNVAAIFVLAFAFAVFMSELKPALLPVVAPRLSAQSPPSSGPAEERLLEALKQEVEERFAYRQAGLTIARLAEQLGTQEYRLRRLINGRLGHRNFNEFLNAYRIAEACERLSDPEHARLPILTIAMDCGYASLGPFNRAFKEITGLTPKAYRAKHGTSRPAPS